MVVHEPLSSENLDLFTNLCESVIKEFLLQAIHGFNLDFLSLLEFLIISLWLLFSGFVPISLLSLFLIFNLLDLLLSNTLMWNYKAWISYCLQLISGLLFIVNSRLTQVQKKLSKHWIRLGPIDWSFPSLLQEFHIPLFERLTCIWISNVDK